MSDSEERASWEELTETQQEIIDTYAKSPGITNEQVAEEVGCAVSYPSRVKSKYSHLVDKRREHYGIEDSGGDAARRIRPAESWDELTEAQQKVVEELLKEDDPTDPDRTHGEIADEVGVHATYVGDVIRKYGDLIQRIAAEQEAGETVEETVEAMPVTRSDGDETKVSTAGMSETGGTPPSVLPEVSDIEETVPIPRAVLETMLDRARTTRQMAEREVEMSDGVSAAHGRLVAAESWEESLETLLALADAIEEADGDVEDALEELDEVPESVARITAE